MSRVVIAGGGLAGSLAALALARSTPELSLLVVEQGPTFGGNHIWSFFDSDVSPADEWVLEGIARTRWSEHDIRFPRRRRTIPIGYNSIRSRDLDGAMRAQLAPHQYRLGTTISELGPNHLVLAEGERIEADAVVDARGAGRMPGQQLAWQKFIGRTCRFSVPHGIERPVIMDGTVEQHDGYRFIYLLPFSEAEILVEDTYYSAEPELDRAAVRARLDKAISGLGAGAPEIAGEEEGVLPLLVDGDFETFWPLIDGIPRLGVRGGFFHPITSYSLPDAVANASLLAGSSEFTAARLSTLLRERSRNLWGERSFFRLLNRMLFRAARPEESYRVLEHFYRLSPDLISRFYAARLRRFDKVRILSGKPPVPLGRAFSVLIGNSA